MPVPITAANQFGPHPPARMSAAEVGAAAAGAGLDAGDAGARAAGAGVGARGGVSVVARLLAAAPRRTTGRRDGAVRERVLTGSSVRPHRPGR
ncbi:hypothetical protein GCM10020369_83110 [Cryptosporangium minutisporangium]|uniref:Uncharacterized protein n=1 Tax=Cryptosporangium minutisporangium TaxID=113569 RepID=A0ABP6TC03_9ACTN